jgi:hypothetical protein
VSAVAGVDILSGAQLLARHGGVVEVRVIKTRRRTIGYFDDLNTLVQAIAPYDGRETIYVTLNPVPPRPLSQPTQGIRG